MAKSQYEYVKGFEAPDALLANTFIVVRVDGRHFHHFVVEHEYDRPNDVRALGLMNRCAQAVMAEFPDISCAFGESDEYSFVFKRSTKLYGRRASKLSSYVVSLFTSSFVMFWPTFFPDKPLKSAPCFDARAVAYPTLKNIRDYLSWRQADTHINNLYNTAFWALVQQGGLTPQEAEKRLRGTDSGMKNEMLFTEFHTNYNSLPALFRKGSFLVWRKLLTTEPPPDGEDRTANPTLPLILHCDIIGNDFWKKNPLILEPDTLTR